MTVGPDYQLHHVEGDPMCMSRKYFDIMYFSSSDNRSHKIYFVDSTGARVPVPFEKVMNVDMTDEYIVVPDSSKGEIGPFRVSKADVPPPGKHHWFKFYLDDSSLRPSKELVPPNNQQSPPVVDADG
jgi:hypothetical protein